MANETKDRRAEDRKKLREETTKQLDAQQAEREQAGAASAKRMASAKPTPTQRENDLAKVGALTHLDEKEDDGSGPEMVHVRTVVPASEAEGPGYRTRSAENERPARPQPQPHPVMPGDKK